MKKILSIVTLMVILSACNNNTDKDIVKTNTGKFTVTGELKNVPDQRIYLFQSLFDDNRSGKLIDSAAVKNGKFTISATSNEEGLYVMRLEKSTLFSLFIFINDSTNIYFTGDGNNYDMTLQIFNTPANHSLREFFTYVHNKQQSIDSRSDKLNDLEEEKDALVKYHFQYADTTKSPIVALIAITTASDEPAKLQEALAKLAKRFPTNTSIANANAAVKKNMVALKRPQQNKPDVGAIAPDITMNDVDGKPFSLSQLRGKYVLIDFWASWCGPCRGENPNVVNAYNKFKDKNFTVLGVSLDNNKEAWLNAIKADKLAWYHISDLKQWESPVIGMYGFDGIPYNVLIDPQGKIIATDMRGEELDNKLKEVLK